MPECGADLGAMRLGGPRLRCKEQRPCPEHERRAPTLDEMEARFGELGMVVARQAIAVADAEREEKQAEEAWHAARSHTWQEQQKLDEATRHFANLRDSIARAREEQQR